jgi:hypothetical protein
MPRKATDLLDVFRHQRAQPARPAARAKEDEPRRAGFQGLVLLPRHVLLGSAVVVLLLVFAFVFGVSVGGRRGQGSGPGVEAARLTVEQPRDDTRRIYVEARVPYMDPARQALNDPARLHASLVRQKGIPPERVWVTDELGAAQLRILMGPFPTQALAADYLHRAGYFTFSLGGVLPWKSPEYLWLSERELPRQHLPAR